MRRLLLVAGCCAGMLFSAGTPSAQALAHGCASVSNDYSLGFDLVSRSAVASVNRDAPCSFTFVAGDTYSGSGKFTVSCSTGGRYDHPDFQDGQYPPVYNVAIPTPCEPGAIVTLDGHHLGTGGMVVAGSAL